MAGSKYTNCLGDCAEQKGQSRSACIPQSTLIPSTPQQLPLPDFSSYSSGSSDSGGSTGTTSGDGFIYIPIVPIPIPYIPPIYV
jgi:hypothetical protein